MKFIFLILFVSFAVCFAIFVLKVIKAQIARVFTENYAKLKQIYPTPLHTWGGLTGSLSTKWITNLQFRGTLKIDVYADMLIVSAMGQGLCLRYDQYVFKQKQVLFLHYLVVENLPVQGKSSTAAFTGPIDFGQLTTLQVLLSVKKIDTIIKLAQDKSLRLSNPDVA
ncbi:MAG: hypothetical protein J6Y17_03010 [Elusimicrobiaceae bacterium]|nr:hypothetical protein [Elusimicrobiaceae bacterium]